MNIINGPTSDIKSYGIVFSQKGENRTESCFIAGHTPRDPPNLPDSCPCGGGKVKSLPPGRTGTRAIVVRKFMDDARDFRPLPRAPFIAGPLINRAGPDTHWHRQTKSLLHLHCYHYHYRYFVCCCTKRRQSRVSVSTQNDPSAASGVFGP